MLGRFRGIALLSSALALVAGCGGEPAAAAGELALHADEGPFAGTLMIDAPHVGQHRVVIVLSDDPETSEPLEGAMVRLSPWMPAHGHGSTDVIAHEEEPGVYVADDVWLNMPGIWDLRVHVDAGVEGDLTATIEVP